MEPADNQSVETSLRQLRIIHAAMLASIVLYAFISYRAPFRPAPQPMIIYAIAAVCVADFAIIVVLRSKLLPRSGMISSTESDPKIVLARWRSACIVTWAMCEAIALFGLVLRYMGFAITQVIWFFIAGFALMTFFTPRQPEQLLKFGDR
jgi:hypothetical protein